MRRLLLPVALLVAGCGGQSGNGVFERAQHASSRFCLTAVRPARRALRRGLPGTIPFDVKVELSRPRSTGEP